jgi:hypothetical protein
MTYLNSLKAEKQAREAYERDQIRMKEMVFKIAEYHNIYDAEFLNKLEEFIVNFEKEKGKR